jgi:hypothetical protein
MKSHKLAILLFAVVALVGCRNRENAITAAYGDGIVTGQVISDGEVDGSAAGIEVRVLGTGMSMVVDDGGRFTFAGVPSRANLHFSRADGIDASIPVTSREMNVRVSGLRVASDKAKKPKVAQLEGLILDIDGDMFIMYTSKKVEQMVLVTEVTRIRKGNETLTIDDLEVGYRVHVKGLSNDGKTKALEVIVQNTNIDDPDDGEDDGDDDGGTTPPPTGGQTMTANGLVLSVSGSDLVVRSQSKGNVTVRTDANTIIKRQGKRIQVSEIKPNDEVNSLGTRVDATTLLARQIEVRGKSKKNN